MKKNNLLPILLVSGAGVAAYFYFKNKSANKEFTKGIDITESSETENNESLADQSTTTSEEKIPVENKIESYIKTGGSIVKAGKQYFSARKKRKSSNTDKKISKRKTRKAARSTRKKTRPTRKNKKVLTGFEF